MTDTMQIVEIILYSLLILFYIGALGFMGRRVWLAAREL